MKQTRSLITVLLLALLAPVYAEPLVVQEQETSFPEGVDPKAPPAEIKLVPTFSNIAYGKHERQVLDFYQAKSEKPTPVLFAIHGGAWNHGDKSEVGRMLVSFGGKPTAIDEFKAAGISVVAINYRYITQAKAEGVTPPVIGPLHDAARALQFVRSKAKEWNIDPERIAAAGGSAGGASSLWLALHDDLREPGSADPIARESTRLVGAAVLSPQTTLDPKEVFEWIPNTKGYGGHAFGVEQDRMRNLSAKEAYLTDRERFLPWIAEYSPIELITSNDPPLFLYFRDAPALGHDAKDPTHTANYGVKFQEKCKRFGIKSEFVHGGSPERRTRTVIAYLFEVLGGTSAH